MLLLPALRTSVLSSVSVVCQPLRRRVDSAASWAVAVPISTLPAARILSRIPKFCPKKRPRPMNSVVAVLQPGSYEFDRPGCCVYVLTLLDST